jgi:hypothetical protein
LYPEPAAPTGSTQPSYRRRRSREVELRRPGLHLAAQVANMAIDAIAITALASQPRVVSHGDGVHRPEPIDAHYLAAQLSGTFLWTRDSEHGRSFNVSDEGTQGCLPSPM